MNTCRVCGDPIDDDCICADCLRTTVFEDADIAAEIAAEIEEVLGQDFFDALADESLPPGQWF
jgi:hypothetical protein